MKRKIIILIAVLLTFVGVTSMSASAAAKPDAPVITASNIADSGKNRIVWSEITDASYYCVYRSKTKSGEYECVETTSGLSYTDNAVSVGETYYYCVKAINTDGISSSESNKLYLTCKLPCPEVTLSIAKDCVKICVEWTTVEGAQGYQVYRSTSQTGKYTLIKNTTETSFTDMSTEAGKVYYYKVCAIAGKSSANSAYSSLKSKECILSQPQMLRPQVNSDGELTLSWKFVNGARNYRIYRSEKKTSGYIRLASLTKRKFTDTTVDSGKTYYYKVRAVCADSVANSVFSSFIGVKMMKSDGLAVGVMQSDDGAPVFVWQSVENATSYKVYRSLYNDKGFSLLSTRTVCNYTNKSIPRGLTFYYKFVASDDTDKKLATSRVIKFTTKLKEEEILKTRYVNRLAINLYSHPDKNSQSMPLRYMEQVKLGNYVLSRTDGKWYRVFYKDELYYLWSKDIESILTPVKSAFEYAGNTIYQQEVIDFAVEIADSWETVYAHGQSNGVTDIEGVSGFDCSGFVKFVFNTVMQKYVPVYDLSADVQKLYETTDIYNYGYAGEFNAIKVDINDIQPGDVLFFKSLADGSASAEIGHCGIYLGNNEYAHSTSSWDDAVCIVPLSGSYLENYVGACRFLPDEVISVNETKYIVGPYYNYNLYSDHSPDSQVIDTLALYDSVTLLYTDNGNWAYVQTENGEKGYVLTAYLSEYVYHDCIELKGQLNGENKPSLYWNKVPDAISYDIYRSLKKDSGYSLLSSTEKTGYTNLSAPMGLDLYYKVVARDASGAELNASDCIMITTPLESEELLLVRYLNLPQTKLYTLPDTSSDSIILSYMEELLLGAKVTSSTSGSWYRVFYNDRLFYLWQGVDEEKLTSDKSIFMYEVITPYQQQVIELAMDIYYNWDTIYATGQSDGVINADGTYGFNSPGFVKYVLNTAMKKYVPTYDLPVVLNTLYATDSVYNDGYSGEFCVENVSIDNIKAGDVLFFGTDSQVSYCGIYLGKGEFISCQSSWDDGVRVMPLSGKYSDALISIRRYLPETVASANQEATINGPYMNYKIYEAKSADSAVVATVSQGDSVTVLFTDNKNWAYIETNFGIRGFIFAKYMV